MEFQCPSLETALPSGAAAAVYASLDTLPLPKHEGKHFRCRSRCLWNSSPRGVRHVPYFDFGTNQYVVRSNSIFLREASFIEDNSMKMNSDLRNYYEEKYTTRTCSKGLLEQELLQQESVLDYDLGLFLRLRIFSETRAFWAFSILWLCPLFFV